MKKTICATFAGLIILVLTGCAPVKFYSNLKGFPQAAAASTTTELYEIFMGSNGTTVKKVEFK
jgi:hypothetical protein